MACGSASLLEVAKARSSVGSCARAGALLASRGPPLLAHARIGLPTSTHSGDFKPRFLQAIACSLGVELSACQFCMDSFCGLVLSETKLRQMLSKSVPYQGPPMIPHLVIQVFTDVPSVSALGVFLVVQLLQMLWLKGVYISVLHPITTILQSACICARVGFLALHVCIRCQSCIGEGGHAMGHRLYTSGDAAYRDDTCVAKRLMSRQNCELQG